MATYRVKMQHTEDSFKKLSRKQYDLFCRSNLIVRTVISIGLIFFGSTRLEEWWGVLLIVYGGYLFTSKYSQSDHTARKLAKQIRERGMPFPASEYVFRKNYMEITSLPVKADEEPDHLPYKEIFGLGEDWEYFYVFRDRYGGYMIPKDQLNGKSAEFRAFIQRQTGKVCKAGGGPLVNLIRQMNIGRKK